MTKATAFGVAACAACAVVAATAPAEAGLVALTTNLGSVSGNSYIPFTDPMPARNDTFKYFYTFTVAGAVDVNVVAGVSGRAGRLPTAIIALFSGVPGSGVLYSDPSNPSTLVSSGGGVGASLGGPDGWRLTPGAYTIEVAGTSHSDLVGLSGSLSTAAAPEMQTWAMLSLGFAAIGLGLARKAKAPTCAV